MKIILKYKIVLALLVTGLIAAGCKKEEVILPAPFTTNAPTRTIEVIVTNQPPTPAKPLSPLEAKNHVGETATVRGKVFGIHVTQKGDVFINIGGAFPNAPFTAVCFQGAIPTDDLKKFDGKIISITGLLKDYNGQIEIVLEHKEQISE